MLARLFKSSPKLMASNVIDPNRAIHWILDWDGTLTKHDTLNALVNIAHNAKPDAKVPEAWKDLVQAYLLDYKTHMKKSCHNGLPSTVLEQQLFFDSLLDVEAKSVGRVSSSGIFKGLTSEDIETGSAAAIESGEVQLRTGSHGFLQHLKRRTSREVDDLDAVDVVSVNWSQQFIAGCLKASVPGLRVGRPAHWSNVQYISRFGHTRNAKLEYLISRRCERYNAYVSNATEDITIYANELQSIAFGQPSTGNICEGTQGLKLMSSSEKLRHLQLVRRINPLTMKPIPIVYVGDSCTDFDCLLAAELGICMRDEPMTSSQKELKDALERVGINCRPIESQEQLDEGSVVWARDFVEVQAWLEKKR